MGNGEWGMGNGKLQWGEKVVSVLLDPAQLRRIFFGDGGMWASVAIGHLYIQGESILLVFLFVLNHGKNLMEKPIHKSDCGCKQEFLPAPDPNNQFVLVRLECDWYFDN